MLLDFCVLEDQVKVVWAQDYNVHQPILIDAGITADLLLKGKEVVSEARLMPMTRRCDLRNPVVKNYFDFLAQYST